MSGIQNNTNIYLESASWLFAITLYVTPSVVNNSWYFGNSSYPLQIVNVIGQNGQPSSTTNIEDAQSFQIFDPATSTYMQIGNNTIVPCTSGCNTNWSISSSDITFGTINSPTITSQGNYMVYNAASITISVASSMNTPDFTIVAINPVQPPSHSTTSNNKSSSSTDVWNNYKLPIIIVGSMSLLLIILLIVVIILHHKHK